MVGEYIGLAGGGLEGFWSEQLQPMLLTLRSSPFFWPGFVLAVAALFLLARRLSR